MTPYVPDTRWTYGVFSAFFVIDLLMAWRIVQRVILHAAPISPDGPVFFVLVVALQVVVLRLLLQLGHSISHYQSLKRNFEQELDLSRQVMECAEEGLSVLDELGRFVYVNAALCQLLGRAQAEVLGRHLKDFTPQGDSAFWEQPGATTAALQHACGQLRPVRVRAQPRWYAGRMVGHIVSFVPTTS